MTKKISIVSGGFDPIHSGHIEYIRAAKALGDYLIICLNSDAWLIQKKGKFFMPFEERKAILQALSYVDEVIDFEDDELGSCINGLKKAKELHKNCELIFCNGGDRDSNNIPEMIVEGINFEFSVGGDNKKNSSSWILKKWKYDSEDRVWGSFYNLFEDQNVKVKELVVSPKSGMSYQRHFKRSEIWFISQGKCLINHSKDDPQDVKETILEKDETFFVPLESWHQITNPFDEPCHIIEIQYGEATIEEDIERLHYFKDEK